MLKKGAPPILSLITTTFLSANLLLSVLGLLNAIGFEFYFGAIPRVYQATVLGLELDRFTWQFTFAFLTMFPIVKRFFPWRSATTFVALGVATLMMSVSETPLWIQYAMGILLLLLYVSESESIVALDKFRFMKRVAVCNLVFLLAIEALATAVLLYYPFDRQLVLSSWAFHLVKQDISIFYAAYLLSLPMLLVLINSWAWAAPLLLRGKVVVSGNSAWRVWPDFFLVAITAAFLSFVAAYPWLINRGAVGVDTEWYRSRLEIIKSPSLAIVSSDPRGFYLWLLSLLKFGLNISTSQALVAGSVLSSFLLSMSTYLFVSLQNREIAFLAALFSIFSVQTAVGVFAGIFSNWFSLAESTAYFTALSLWVRTRTNFYYLLSLGLAFLLMITHAWTWAIVVLATSAVTVVLLWQSVWKKGPPLIDLQKIMLLLSINFVVPIVVLFVGYGNPVLFGVRSGLSQGVKEVIPSISLTALTNIHASLQTTLTLYVQSFLVAPVVYVFALLGLYVMAREKNMVSVVIVSWVASSSVLALLMTPWYQWRLLYVTPFYLLLAVGVHKLSKLFAMQETDSMLLSVSIKVLPVVMMLNYVLRGGIQSVVGFPV